MLDYTRTNRLTLILEDLKLALRTMAGDALKVDVSDVTSNFKII